MNGISELGNYLCGMSDSELIREAAKYLSGREEWLSLAYGALESISDHDFFENAARVRVPNVQPRTFPIYRDRGGFSIVLNYYDRQRFESAFNAGHITPHIHHFSFASRVLHGRFCEYLFDNSGSKEVPHLTLAATEWHSAGDVYTRQYDRYHCIMAPSHETITLLVRSRPLFANPHLNAGNYTFEDAMSERAKLTRAFSALTA